MFVDNQSFLDIWIRVENIKSECMFQCSSHQPLCVFISLLKVIVDIDCLIVFN